MAYSTHSPQIKQTQWPGKSLATGRIAALPGFVVFPAGRGNNTSARGERNAYRPERVPSGDGLHRAPEDLQAVHQAHAGDHCRRGCADGVPLHLRGLTAGKSPPDSGVTTPRPLAFDIVSHGR